MRLLAVPRSLILSISILPALEQYAPDPMDIYNIEQAIMQC